MIKELIKERDLAKDEMNKLLELAKSEERQLTETEQDKFNELEVSVRSCNSQIEQKITELADAEVEAERKAKEDQAAKEKESLRQKLYDEGWSEIESSIRGMDVQEAEAELEKARIDYDLAWGKYWEVYEELESALRKEELKVAIKEVLDEVGERKLKEDKEELETKERRLAEEKEAEERRLKIEQEKNMEGKFNLSRALVQLANGGVLKDKESERSAQLASDSGVGTTGVLFGLRDFSVGTQSGNTDKSAVMPMSVIGSNPIWQRMGCRYLPNLQGTITLPHKSPRTAQAVAEKVALTHDTVTSSGVVMAPARVGDSQIWSKELLASENPSLHEAMIQDMLIGLDRQITADVYTKAIAGSTEVTGFTVTKPGFDSLMAGAEVENEGSFAAARSTFFEAKAVAIDAGSGRFLASLSGQKDMGQTYEGVPFFYSSLFSDGADKKYVLYGDFYNIVVGDWGMYEVIINPYTYAKEGQLEITVSRIVKVVMHNPAAFVRSQDLDV